MFLEVWARCQMPEFQRQNWSERLRVELQNKRGQARRLHARSAPVLYEAHNKTRYEVLYDVMKNLVRCLGTQGVFHLQKISGNSGRKVNGIWLFGSFWWKLPGERRLLKSKTVVPFSRLRCSKRKLVFYSFMLLLWYQFQPLTAVFSCVRVISQTADSLNVALMLNISSLSHNFFPFCVNADS